MNQTPDHLWDHPHADHPIALEFPATIAVIGGGPIGLEATLYGRFLGYEVTLFEQGEVAENIRQWQHVSMWTPFHYLHSRLGKLAIETQSPGHTFPNLQQEVTGEQWLEKYLLPLAATDLVAKSLRTRHRVISVSRCHYAKHQAVANESRWQDGFVVVWEDTDGIEQSDTFDFVIDASGTFHQQQPWGAGGSPALGEKQLRLARKLDPQVSAALHVVAPDFASQLDRWKDARVLVVGDSPQAAETVTQWLRLDDRGSLVWVISQTPSDFGLYPMAANDPLPARVKLFDAANQIVLKNRLGNISALTQENTAIASELPRRVQVVANTNLTSLHWDVESQKFQVRLCQWFDVDWATAPDDFEEPDDREVMLEFDQVVIATGHGVDESFTSQLIVPRCPQTEAMAPVSDALRQYQGDRFDFELTTPAWTLTPEGRFFVLGAKSFGRQPNYFYRLGLQQVREAFRWIVGRANLDLEQTLRS
jgi:hypothetical protein